ncbi:MAG: hypothetical protein HWE25_02545 [Alphaproteobacteria bacterium]|nr:hypothetical protein [Alphaproteobacteria bacterium]
MANTNKNGSSGLIIHYMTMRKAIGWLGLLYPFIMVIGSFVMGETGMRMSISQYYHSPMGDFFVGILFAQAMFLFAYQGYNYDADNPGHKFFIRLSDNAAGNIAAIAAVGTAIFPTIECNVTGGCGTNTSAYLHWIFSASFFLILSYICLCLFVQTGDIEPTIQKKKRNRVYKTCGYLMLLAMAGAVVKGLLPADIEAVVDEYNPIFWLETIAVLSFGFSWFVKGEAIFADLPYEPDDEAE